MIINIKVHPGSNSEKIVKISDKELEVWLKERAVDGRANLALIKILSKEFRVSQRDVSIKTPRSRNKIVKIAEPKRI